MIKVMLYSALAGLSVFTGENKLIGRWESKPSEKGNVTGVVFNDSTFEEFHRADNDTFCPLCYTIFRLSKVKRFSQRITFQ